MVEGFNNHASRGTPPILMCCLNSLLSVKEEDEKKPTLVKDEPDAEGVKPSHPATKKRPREEFMGVVIEVNERVEALKRAFFRKEKTALKVGSGRIQRPHKNPTSLREAKGKCDNCKNKQHCQIEWNMTTCKGCFDRKLGCYWEGTNRLGKAKKGGSRAVKTPVKTPPPLRSNHVGTITRPDSTAPSTDSNLVVEEQARRQFIKSELSRLKVKRAMIESEIERWTEKLAQ